MLPIKNCAIRVRCFKFVMADLARSRLISAISKYGAIAGMLITGSSHSPFFEPVSVPGLDLEARVSGSPSWECNCELASDGRVSGAVWNRRRGWPKRRSAPSWARGKNLGSPQLAHFLCLLLMRTPCFLLDWGLRHSFGGVREVRVQPRAQTSIALLIK
ncbi:uncharacterized protein BDV17DRAFT_224096 [Aspergillus undulatus]|uniref:uncharacterized protein n=1 Tax=Aspergillus undulatus TaxID=1810928 RepID=UPI003CCD379D